MLRDKYERSSTPGELIGCMFRDKYERSSTPGELIGCMFRDKYERSNTPGELIGCTCMFIDKYEKSITPGELIGCMLRDKYERYSTPGELIGCMFRDKYERSSTPGRKVPSTQQFQRNQSATAQLSWSQPSLVNSPDYQQVGVPPVSPEQLQHDLLVELQGDPADLKSKAWYHGSVSRQRAEGLVTKNGDFLIRDCISNPGNFVLSCCWKGGPLHFVINSTLFDQGPGKLPKVSYHFEELYFSSVQELVQYYMDECKTITDISGAVITTPIARSMPLSFYDSKYGVINSKVNMHGHTYSNITISRNSSVATTMQSVPPNVTLPNPIASMAMSRSLSGSGLSQQHRSPHTPPFGSPLGTSGFSPKVSPSVSPQQDRRITHVERSGSQPLLSVNDVPVFIPPPMDRADSLPVLQDKYRQVTPVRDMPGTFPLEDSGIYKLATPSLSVSSNAPPVSSSVPQPAYFHHRSGSAPVLTPGFNLTQTFDLLTPPTPNNHHVSDSDLSKAPPPKPSRIPSVKYLKKPDIKVRNKALYEDDDRDYSDYGQVKSEPSWLHEPPTRDKEVNEKMYDNSATQLKSLLEPVDVNQNVSKSESRKISDTKFNILDGHDDSNTPAFPLELNLKGGQKVPAKTNQVMEPKVKIPKIESESSFNVNNNTSKLLPNENKLLEPSVLMCVRTHLLETNAQILAKHLTKVDLEHLKVITDDDLGLKVTSGLELITLPQGKQHRLDVLERIYCLQAFIKVMILTCPKVSDRAAMVSQWIQVAVETKGPLGNHFAFENIMEALVSDQIQRLRDTWMVLRQTHTNSAFMFDTKLRPAFRMLHDGSSSLPVHDVSIPSINPIVHLLERTLDDKSYLPWETTDINNSLDVMLIHLDLARIITAQCGMYKVTGKLRIKDLEICREKYEMFHTVFHLRFLWGFKGAGVNRTERHNKFTMLLTAYSEKIEKADDDGTAV
ncbi:breast cancer anti-estrogen resistance protein 3 homolog isoform X6 [Dreissena polymorpha]|uniref:breast cancer anti-estrogen resistance protein 3 homolog isoform X6 n=1 Tax=Dreissena polymorpha TaxID=45954 RepID=UPI0022647AD2|nr:breast cancer anti-estrogen resistance protein 3 homolog isoform X6 [Dreissena polymorpha]